MRNFFYLILIMVFIITMFFLEGNVCARGSDNKILQKSIAVKEFHFSTSCSPEIDKIDKSLVLENYLEENRAALCCIMYNAYT